MLLRVTNLEKQAEASGWILVEPTMLGGHLRPSSVEGLEENDSGIEGFWDRAVGRKRKARGIEPRWVLWLYYL